MPKVMMILEATTGGTMRHLVDLATACRGRGFDVHLVCGMRRDPSVHDTFERLRESGIIVSEFDMCREIRPFHDGLAVAQLRSLIKRSAPDVLHLHSSKAGALGRIATLGLGPRQPAVVYTPHAYAFLDQPSSLRRWSYWCIERILLAWTDLIIAVSESEASAASRLGAKRVITVSNGVKVGQPERRERADQGQLRIGWLGRMEWQKNPLAAVKVSELLSSEGVEHELVLGGNGGEFDRTLAEIRKLNVEASVRTPGFVRDTDAFYAHIDILLFTSRFEGLPYVGLDAMANQLPIVGFDVPGVCDLVTHEVSGLLAAPGSHAELVAHLARLARDPGLRRRMGKAGLRKVNKLFSLDDQMNRIIEVYESFGHGAACEQKVDAGNSQGSEVRRLLSGVRLNTFRQFQAATSFPNRHD